MKMMMSEAKGYARVVGRAEDEYLPSGPPMSPLTQFVAGVPVSDLDLSIERDILAVLARLRGRG